jgi:hypothetical protein
MSNLTRGNLFDAAYDAIARGMASATFAGGAPWATLVPSLRALVAGVHFDEAHATSLDGLRKAASGAARAKTGATSEGAFLAGGAGLAGTISPTQLDPAAVLRCAALKTLRHTYFLRKRGNQKVWIVALPKSFTQWSDRYLNCGAIDLIPRMDAADEQFDVKQRKNIADAALMGLRWTLKAQAALADLGPKGKGLALLRRWFADEATTDDQLKAFAPTLLEGLKKIAFKLSAGSLIVTDFVPIRGSTAPNEVKILASNAFVGPDAKDTIYIEPPFFQRGAKNVFQSDSHHWARIMVHELSHREARTKDKRYGWNGIRPAAATLPHADAIINADSWAIFVADAAGAMTAGDRARALDGA